VSEKLYLILAEGKSGDPHFGKTARGIMRYAPDRVVALLDTERAGENEHGFRIVGSVEEGVALGPTTALVGVATSGGRFPPAFRAQIRACVEHGRPGSSSRSAPTARSGR